MGNARFISAISPASAGVLELVLYGKKCNYIEFHQIDLRTFGTRKESTPKQSSDEEGL